MLFVIIMEVLNSLIREADRHGTLSPIPGRVISNRTSLCADDVVLLVALRRDDLQCVQQILHLFAGASGLVTNIDKCVLSPIRCTEDMIAEVQDAFPCVLAPFPCKYLGIPLSLRRLRRCNEQALVDKVVARIPTWKSGLLNHAGHALLTKVTLSAIPVHVSIAYCLLAWAIAQIDKCRRAFVWAGS